jgi:pimeloyl-ACP methyl ester carboxylesterase
MTSIASYEYTAKKGDVELRIYRKYAGTPEGKRVLMLVHGSSLSAMPSYDVQVPGANPGYSFMDQCAQRGFDVWTMDHEGYGRSSRTDSNSNIGMAVGDLSAAAAVVEKETGKSHFHCYGQSSGALRAALFAQKQPHRIDRLVLDAFVWTGEGSPTLAKRREQLPYLLKNNVRKIDKDMIRSIFTRDKPGTSEPIIADAVAEAQLSYGEMIPTGTYLDMCANLPVVDPEQIGSPVLIMRGEHDGIATMQDLTAFFEKLPNSDKEFAVLPGTAHIPHFGVNRHRFYHILFAFLEMPERRDIKH